MVLDLYDKRIIAVEGEKGGRIFTNFNLIKRELRAFCTIDGVNLSYLDLKCSQPFLLASYLFQKYPEEAKDFYNIVINDDIYLWFLKKWQDSGKSSYLSFNPKENRKLPKYIETRDDAKIEFLKMIFKSSGETPQFEIIFKNEFPELYKKFKAIQPDLASTTKAGQTDHL